MFTTTNHNRHSMALSLMISNKAKNLLGFKHPIEEEVTFEKKNSSSNKVIWGGFKLAGYIHISSESPICKMGVAIKEIKKNTC